MQYRLLNLSLIFALCTGACLGSGTSAQQPAQSADAPSEQENPPMMRSGNPVAEDPQEQPNSQENPPGTVVIQEGGSLQSGHHHRHHFLRDWGRNAKWCGLSTLITFIALGGIGTSVFFNLKTRFGGDNKKAAMYSFIPAGALYLVANPFACTLPATIDAR